MTAVTPGRIVRRWLRLEIGSTRDIDQSATRQKSKKVFSPKENIAPYFHPLRSTEE
jgi:hypothetical protein